MYVIARNMKVSKEISQSLIDDYSEPSAVNKADGFIRRDLLVNTKGEEMDVIKIVYYWKDKESLDRWHASKEHQAMHIEQHKKQKASGKEPISRKDLNLTVEEFELIATLNSK